MRPERPILHPRVRRGPSVPVLWRTRDTRKVIWVDILPKLRDKLEINKKIVDGAVGCIVRNPNTGETFEFGEIECFLLRKLDGASSPDKLIEAVERTYEVGLTREDLADFVEGLRGNGLLSGEASDAIDDVLSPQVDMDTLDDWESDLLQGEDLEGIEHWAQGPSAPLSGILRDDDAPFAADVAGIAERFEAARRRRTGLLKPPNRYLRLFRTSGFFATLSRLLYPFSYLVFLLPPLVVVAVFTVSENWTEVRFDMGHSWGIWTVFGHLVFSLVTVNLVTKLLSGTIARGAGADAPGFGIALAIGVIPRFHVEITDFDNLPKRSQLWLFGGPLLVRLFLFSFAAIGWLVTRSSGTQLPIFLFFLATVSMFSFFITSNPLGRGDGYAFFSTWFDVPMFRNQAFRVLLRPLLPESMRLEVSEGRAAALRAYALAAIAWMLFLIGAILYLAASWLEVRFEGTGIVVFLILAMLIFTQIFGQILKLRKAVKRHRKIEEAQGPEPEAGMANGPPPNTSRRRPHPAPPRSRSARRKKRSTRRVLVWLLFAASIAALWFIPYHYETGGSLELRPIQRREVYAEIPGVVSEIPTPGGEWIEKGAVLGQIADYRQLEEVDATKAQIEKNQADLDRLLTTPREEEVRLAERQYEAARLQEEFWTSQLKRQEQLLKDGHTTQEEFDTTRQKAEVAGQEVLEKEASLDLVKEGPHPEEIKAARAELKRLQAQLASNEERLIRTTMRTTIPGRITNLEIENLEGAYLEAGDLFAEVIDDRALKAYINIPEGDLGKITIGGRARLKFWAYPQRIFLGTVSNIEPVLTEEAFGRVVPVVVELSNENGELKAGMTGYGKISAGMEPVIVAFTHRIVRFVKVEIWSWIP